MQLTGEKYLAVLIFLVGLKGHGVTASRRMCLFPRRTDCRVNDSVPVPAAGQRRSAPTSPPPSPPITTARVASTSATGDSSFNKTQHVTCGLRVDKAQQSTHGACQGGFFHLVYLLSPFSVYSLDTGAAGKGQ